MINEKGYKIPESEEEYWEEFKKWKKRMKKLRNKLLKSPANYIDEFTDIMYEAVDRELLEKEYVEEKLEKLYKEFRLPQEFINDIKAGKKSAKDYIKKRAKKWFKRKNNDT